MKLALVLVCGCLAAVCQEAPKKEGVPIYNVTVVERTTKAINYAYRGGPTKIDFRGTVLLPMSKGEATVEAMRGRVEIDAKFDGLLPSQRFGREYLTYTLWAITPEGAAHNIGEVMPDGGNKARLRVTTDLQAFALVVTAEPYSSSRKPSDVVVMENQVRPDTVGKIEALDAKYELLPRGEYKWEVPTDMDNGVQNAPKVSMREYEAILELYEAQNAVGIARAGGAEQYASDTLAKAQRLLEEAQRLQASKSTTNVVVETAREAAQTAEDARMLAEKRRASAQLAMAQQEVAQARQAQVQAQAQAAQAQMAASQAQMDADAARTRGEADRMARQRAEADAADARSQMERKQAEPAPVVTVLVPDAGPTADEQQKTSTRMRLCRQLGATLPTLDTPRGVVVTVAGSDFNGVEPAPLVTAEMNRVVEAIAQNPDLRVDVQGYWDSSVGAEMAERRAEAVRNLLVSRGLSADRVTAHGEGDARPVASNALVAGRMANRRVEVVISGRSIGDRAVWDRTYSVVPR